MEFKFSIMSLFLSNTVNFFVVKLLIGEKYIINLAIKTYCK